MPCRSSSSPGASPTNISLARSLPTPKTMVCRPLCNLHRVHSPRSVRTSSRTVSFIAVAVAVVVVVVVVVAVVVAVAVAVAAGARSSSPASSAHGTYARKTSTGSRLRCGVPLESRPDHVPDLMRERPLAAGQFGARAILREHDGAIRLLAKSVCHVVGDDQVELLALQLLARVLLDVLGLGRESHQQRVLRARSDRREDVGRAHQAQPLIPFLLLHFLRRALGGTLVGDGRGHHQHADRIHLRVDGARPLFGGADLNGLYTRYTR